MNLARSEVVTGCAKELTRGMGRAEECPMLGAWKFQAENVTQGLGALGQQLQGFFGEASRLLPGRQGTNRR